MMRHRDSHIPTQAVGSLALWRFLLVTWKGQFPPFCIASRSLPVEVRRVLPAALLCEPTDQETTTEDFKRLAELLCATSSLLSLPDGIIYDVRVFLFFI